MYFCIKNYMNEVGSLQIGHTSIKENDFKIECEVVNDRHVEVSFSHRHFFYAIYWEHEESGKHIIDFEEYEIKSNRIFFIRPEQVHFLHEEGRMKYSALQFTEDFMTPYLATIQKGMAVFKDIVQEEKERIAILFNQIYAESVSCLPNSCAIIQSEINTLLLELERISLPTFNVSTMPELLNKYKDMIDKNFMRERQVQSYAAQLGISSNYLNVLTRKHLGKSALNMINDRVMLEIKRLLLRTDYDISEIAYKLGFNELSYFSRFFKRNTGMTPIEFRQSMNEMYQR